MSPPPPHGTPGFDATKGHGGPGGAGQGYYAGAPYGPGAVGAAVAGAGLAGGVAAAAVSGHDEKKDKDKKKEKDGKGNMLLGGAAGLAVGAVGGALLANALGRTCRFLSWTP
jgi:hypothetical protein